MVNKLYFIVVVVVMLYGPNCTDFPSLSQRKIAGLSFTNETLRIIINGNICLGHIYTVLILSIQLYAEQLYEDRTTVFQIEGLLYTVGFVFIYVII